MGLKKYLTLFLIYFVILFFYKDNILSTKFVDEEYNFAIGKYLASGEKLYDDIITNHQPIPAIFSSLTQKITHPSNAYLMIRNHRLAILAWSFFWGAVLVTYFGAGAFMFLAIYELTKGYLFGNLFLAESLVVYPLIFLISQIIVQKKQSRLMIYLTGIAFGLCGFLFGPIIPLLIFLIFLLNPKPHIVFISGLASVFLLLLPFTNLWEYIYYYLYTNLTFTVPTYHQSYYNEPWVLTIFKSFITPVLAFTRLDSTPTLNITRILVVSLIVNLIYISRKKITLLVFLALGLCNLRFVYPGNENFAAGFLPWYAALIAISCKLAVKGIQSKKKVSTIVNILLFTSVLLLSFKYSKPLIFSNKDPKMDYQINFSTHIDRGEAIKIMKDTDDTILSSPDNWLVYWSSDTKHLPKLFGYLPWMLGIPKLHDKILGNLKNTPPTFFYCENCRGSQLETYLAKYIELKKHNGPTNLFVLKSKVLSISEDQKAKLNYYNFSF